jgi:hypothetical protein
MASWLIRARQLGEQVHPAESLALSIAAATIVLLKQRTTSELTAEKAVTPRSRKQTHPAEKQENRNKASRTAADRSESAPVSSASGLPPVDTPSTTPRTSRILSRYVFRDELSPGESWKRRIGARRERGVYLAR